MRKMLHTASTCTAAATSRYRAASQNSRPHVCNPENGGSQTNATTMPVRIRLPISGHATGVELCGEVSLVSTACLPDSVIQTTHYQCPNRPTPRQPTQAVRRTLSDLSRPQDQYLH